VLAFAYAHPAHFLALGFGVGAAPHAPGTAGTLLAFPLWWLMSAYRPTELFLVLVLLFLAGVWACGRAARGLGEADPGAVCWDETVAFLLVLALVPQEPAWQAAAFVLFRAFDVAKPPPARELEGLPGGLGIMADDLCAAGWTLVILAVAKRLFA